MTLSVVIITKNEENNIAGCLEAVKWADEIIVVDDYSRDKTSDIARRYTDKIFSRKWTGFLDQRRFALGLATCDFVLILDADEIIPEKTKKEISSVLLSEKHYDGYYLKHVTYFLGKRLFFSQRPNNIMRLFRRESGFVSTKSGQRGHEDYSVRGTVKTLSGVLEHRTADTIAERIKKIDRYSTIWAEEYAEYGTPPPAGFKMASAFIKSFIWNFFMHAGFLEGYPGFIWCTTKAMENFLKYAKLWARNRASF